jgi:hypothetical protein
MNGDFDTSTHQPAMETCFYCRKDFARRGINNHYNACHVKRDVERRSLSNMNTKPTVVNQLIVNGDVTIINQTIVVVSQIDSWADNFLKNSLTFIKNAKAIGSGNLLASLRLAVQTHGSPADKELMALIADPNREVVIPKGVDPDRFIDHLSDKVATLETALLKEIET